LFSPWLKDKSIRRQINKIDVSDFFDLSYYQQQNGDIEAEFTQSEAIRHYIEYGSRKSLSPSQKFDTKFYLNSYPDVAESGLNPLLHYLKYGENEGRFPRKPATVTPTQNVLEKAPGLLFLNQWTPVHEECMVVHVYYEEQWPSIEKMILNAPRKIDLIVTLTKGKSDHLKKEIEKNNPGSYCIVFQNHGRDILPFVEILNTGAFRDYKYVCKIHTKKSPHLRHGMRVSKYLLNQLGSRRAFLKNRKILETDENIGIVAPHGYLLGNRFIGPNLKQMRQVANHHHPAIDLQEHFLFPSGSMFWFRPESLDWLRKKGLNAVDFDVEQSQLDGTMAHAVERLFGVSCAQAGLGLAETQPSFLQKPFAPLVSK
jgi:hypothetical protein